MKKLETIPPMPAQQELRHWLAILEAEYKRKQSVRATLPPGHIELSTSHGCQQVHYVQGKLRRYLSAKDTALLKAMTQKRLLQYELESLSESIALVRQLLENQELRPCQRLPEKLRPFAEPATLTDAEFAARWQSITWEHKPVSESLPFYTARGEHVRSKSEIIIANALKMAGVPYRYEYPVKLQNILIHPDFVCLNVRTRCEFYWEHLGRMDDNKYHNDAVERLELYMQAGIFPFDNLLLTVEWKGRQLDSRRVEYLIERYLL